MIYLIGVFFLVLLFFMIYTFTLVQENKRGEFDVRSVTLEHDAIISHAEQLAKNQTVTKGKSGISYLLNRMTNNYTFISNTYVRLIETAYKQDKITGADEWLLDNFYVIEEQTKELRQNIQKKNFKKLPIIKDGQYMGYPRTFAIALEFVSHTDGVITQEMFVEFISAYQKTAYLSDSEVWSLSTMLKIALIENIKYICKGINETHEQYRLSEKLIYNIYNKNHKLGETLMQYLKTSYYENTALIENLLAQFKRRGGDGINGIKLIDFRLNKLNTTSEKVIQIQHQILSSRQVSIGNAITSLRYVMSFNFTEVFELVSQVDNVLKKDPSGIYTSMDENTKNLYRKNVDRIAKNMGISQVEVALVAVELAEKALEDEKKHIGYYLIKTDLGNDNKKEKMKKQKLYFGFVLFLTIIISYMMARYCLYNTNNYLLSVIVFILTVIPSSDIALNFMNYIVAKSTSATIIPRLEITDKILNENKTAVVISTLLTSKQQTITLVNQLETYYLANRHDNLVFGLLSDLADNKEKTTKEDKDIINTATAEIEALNKKYNGEFFLFHRKRTFNEINKIYMGWERKRGAIVEFTKLLKGEKDTTFNKVVGDISKLDNIKYVITLDSDTKLPLESAKELISAMVHPLNKPVINNGIVTDGYALLQPRINVDIESANTSLFSQIFAGQGGIDSYSGAISDIYQDLFGEGIFTGKGIFDVDVFYQILPSAIPENAVLSHDLLEGSYLRCGLISDVTLIDGFPWKYGSYSARQHRWTRGDWQLLPWIFGVIKNPLTSIAKWKMIDNIRRSLVSVCLVIIALLSFYILPNNSLIWIGFIIVTICCSLLISAIDWAVNSGYKCIGQKCNATIIFGLRGIIYQVGLLFLFLPHSAYQTLDAAIRTIYRLTVSRKKMLEWVTASDMDKRLKGGIASTYIKMLPCIVVAVFIAVSAKKYIYVAYILAALWAIAPLGAYLISKPIVKCNKAVKSEDKKFLLDLAKRTWKYFDDFTTISDNYLVPDNYQVSPPNGIAHRTSPTNIGMQLMAYISAKDFGFITEEKMLDMLEKTLGTMDRLEKWNGHFYNWIDTKTLEILRPRYISTVDGGNLAGYLIVIVQALKDINNDRAKAIREKFQKLVDDMDFSYLYEPKRNLFSIGYNVEEEHLTKSYYDLLASEARQASYIAIAKGNVPKKHWAALGRTLVTRDGYKGLVSWTGTMFEYLMPLLIMKNVDNSLLDETYYFLIRCQKKYGRKRNVPWGTSESGFNAFDSRLNYQYKAFGVPDLGLKRGLISDMVVTPYATVMALMVDYDSAMCNLRELLKLNIYGDYGFYEAVDYTPERILPNENYSVVKSYMVHHFGMTLLALNNVINNNILQKRFHSDESIKATEELLNERVPTNVIISKENKEDVQPFEATKIADEEYVLQVDKININKPNIHLLSNGRYSVLLTDGGLGCSKFENINITRFRADIQNGTYGNFVFIKNTTNGNWWTNTFAPKFCDENSYKSIFTPHKAEFYHKGNDGIDTATDVTVSPEEDVEIRKINIVNHSENDVTLEITSFCEVVLNKLVNDISHTAFSNLFIKTEYDENVECVIASRRPKDEKDKVLYAMHTFCVNGEKISSTEFETDRNIFIGRNKTISSPNVIANDMEMRRSVGSVIDPSMSIRFKIKVAKGEKASFAFILAYCDTRDDAILMANKYRNFANVERSFDMAWTRSRIENKYLGINSKLQKAAYEMLPDIIYITNYRKKLSEFLDVNTLQQRDLWSLGISGDNPIVSVFVYGVYDLEKLQDMLIIHELWRLKGMEIDLVVVCMCEHSYNQPVLNSVREMISISNIRNIVNTSGGVFIIDSASVSSEILTLLQAVSKIVINPEKVNKKDEETKLLPCSNFIKKDYPKQTLEVGELFYFNGYGGFTDKEYIIKLSDGNSTPLPWVNIVSNDLFGFLVSEGGSGYCWYGNSRENKLTPWNNDFTSDIAHESIFIRDDYNGEIWNCSSAPIRTNNDYIVHHGFGYTAFETVNQSIKSKLTMFVPIKNPVKYSLLELENKTDENRSITLSYYANTILGVSDNDTKPYIKIYKDNNSLVAENPYNPDYKQQKLYMLCSEKITSYTGDRREFFGSSRGNNIPNGLSRDGFSNTVGSGLDNCLVVQVKINLAPNETKKVAFSLGVSNEISMLPSDCEKELINAKNHWSNLLGTIKVETPDKSMNLMLNGWLLYQTISCRILGRSAFYQSGGAFGFRDQLQDVMALLPIEPEFTKKQIIRSSAHQFLEGDVQHWWHQLYNNMDFEADKGIRTRFSDDLLWLPYTVCEYITVTGDLGILNENAPYLQDEPLKDGEDERYSIPNMSDEKGTIYEHAIRSIERSLKFGEHGLPLMGSGDWNDGMSTVGNEGKGESVWLGWFLYDILVKFSKICENNNDIDSAQKYQKIAQELQVNLNNNAWDGAWYKRAYFDNGKALGSSENTECKIDAIAQAWSVISKAGKEDYQKQSMDSVMKYLVNREDGIIKLLTPPFDNGDLHPGYIKGYVPGVRENGGQYTHAATWVILAYSILGMNDVATDLFYIINPINHSRTQIEASKYKTEPYVIAADVYSTTPNVGRGGWSWYTGASSWFYRVGIEGILGITKRGEKLIIKPHIPHAWKEYSVSYKYKSSIYEIKIKNIENKNIVKEVDLIDDNTTHIIEIDM